MHLWRVLLTITNAARYAEGEQREISTSSISLICSSHTPLVAFFSDAFLK